MSVARRRVAEGATAIRPAAPDDLAELLDARRSSAEHLGPWEPARDASYLTDGEQARLLEKDMRDWETGERLAFAVLDAGAGDRLIGGAALSNIVRGVWQNATLGYWIAADAVRRGHATRAVRLTTAYAFEIAGLHRVQVAVIPANVASLGVARRAGLRHEGTALHYLKIAGRWEHHEIFAATVEDGGALRLPSLH